jgi:hypothetical protein
VRILKLALVLPALHLLGCGRKEEATPILQSAPTASGGGVDYLAPGELVEGKEKAFALILPRDLGIDHAFANEVLAHSDATPEALANYIRAHVRDGTVTVGAMGTTFERVKVPAEPTRELRIRVRTGQGYRSALEVRDTTPPVIEDPGNERDRWKQAGLLPNGQPVDPKHLH